MLFFIWTWFIIALFEWVPCSEIFLPILYFSCFWPNSWKNFHNIRISIHLLKLSIPRKNSVCQKWPPRDNWTTTQDLLVMYVPCHLTSTRRITDSSETTSSELDSFRICRHPQCVLLSITMVYMNTVAWRSLGANCLFPFAFLPNRESDRDMMNCVWGQFSNFKNHPLSISKKSY